jgi:surface protein
MLTLDDLHIRRIIVMAFTLFITTTVKAQRPFVSSWITNGEGASCNTCIEVPVHPDEVYNYEVDIDYKEGEPFTADFTGLNSAFFWDGGVEDTVTIAIRGTFPRIFFNGTGDAGKLLEINQWGDIEWSSMEAAFSKCANMECEATDVPDLSAVTSLAYCFAGCTNLTKGLEDWDVSTIVDMNNLFLFASSFDGDISRWNVEKVENFTNFLNGALSFNQDIGQWDVSNATNTSLMFSNARSFNQDIDNWNIESVINMAHMFSFATTFNQDINSWDMSSVVDITGLFSHAYSFDQDISQWDVSTLTSMHGVFQGARAFNQDLSEWDVSSVTDMTDMFKGATLFNGNINNWDVSNLTSTFNMFSDASSFNQDISQWDMSNVTLCMFMFQRATSFNADISNWDLSSAHALGLMFSGASNFDQDLGAWQFDGQRGINHMFNNSGLSCENYSNTLIGWANNNNLRDSLKLGNVNGLNYNQIGSAARDQLLARGWIIEGDSFTESCLTSTSEDQHKLSDVYPNPTLGNLNITGIREATLTITNLQGQILYTVDGQDHIDISSLDAGIYILRIQGVDTSNVQTIKIVKL